MSFFSMTLGPSPEKYILRMFTMEDELEKASYREVNFLKSVKFSQPNERIPEEKSK
jgi:hypothetical protein